VKSLHVVLSIALVLTFCSSVASATTSGSTDHSTVEAAISELSANLKRMEKRVATLEAHAGIPRRVDLVVPTEVQRQGGARQPDEMAAALSMDYQELVGTSARKYAFTRASFDYLKRRTKSRRKCPSL